jgi:large subunit ribosomal protein L21
MYAVIQSGGKQIKCTPGEVVSVERLEAEPGKDYIFKEVLLAADGERREIGSPHIKGAEVVCEVLGEKKAKKVIAFTFRRRKDSKRMKGHRQIATQMKVKEIKF